MTLQPHCEPRSLLYAGRGGAMKGAIVWHDDETLRRRIAEEFGISGGFGMTCDRVNYWGGINPRIEIQIGADTPIELSGCELLTAVREALGIGRPNELF